MVYELAALWQEARVAEIDFVGVQLLAALRSLMAVTHDF